MFLIREENFDSGYAEEGGLSRPFLFLPGQKIGQSVCIYGIQRSERALSFSVLSNCVHKQFQFSRIA